MRQIPLILTALVLLAFLAGLAHLFRLRFERGDVYPAYSSFRTDPLGTKALLESLEPFVETRRNFRPLHKLGGGRGATLLFLGVNIEDLEFKPLEVREIERFMDSGGRIVFGLAPVPDRSSTNRWTAPPAPRGATAGAEDERWLPVAATNRWKFSLARLPLGRNAQGASIPAVATRQLPSLPETLQIYTPLVFGDLGAEWRTIYARTNGDAVLLERTLGAGSLVLCADSFPFSNEALRADRQSALLAWLLGSGREVIFDEAHLDVRETPGIATLAKKYRLQGLFGAVLVLAVLFVWKNAVSLLPPATPTASDRDPGEVMGRDAASGFASLLRRNIPSGDVLATCLVEWKKSCAHHVPRRRLEAVQRIIDDENARPPQERNPVRTYRAVAEALRLRTSPAPTRPQP